MRALRRFVLLCLMSCLPWQGAWATLAGPCALDSPCATQHQDRAAAHPHADSDRADAADAAGTAAAAQPQGDRCSGDCVNCLGHVLPALLGAPAPLPAFGSALGSSAYSRHVTEPVPEQALRPPLAAQA